MSDPRSKEVADTVVLKISGMTCGGCASAVTRALSAVPGVSKAQVDLASECATVTGAARAEDLIHAVETAGFAGRVA